MTRRFVFSNITRVIFCAALVWGFECPGADPSATDPGPVAQDYLGKWQSEDGKIKFTIEPAYANQQGTENLLKLKGHYEWNGQFNPGDNPKPSRLNFQRTPKFNEMNPDVPEWARKMADGKLKWDFEFDSDCPLTLTGKWYPGEIKWRDDKDPAKREAEVTPERGKPREIIFHPASEGIADSEWKSRSSIRIISKVRPVVDSVLDSVYREEPFMVEVRVPHQKGKTPDPSVTVNFLAMQSGKTTSIVLPENGGIVYTIYDTPRPITLRNYQAGDPGGVGVGPWFGLNVEKGETVQVSCGDAKAQFTAYVQPVEQAVARTDMNLRNIWALYDSMLQDSRVSAADKEILHQKLRIAANARQIMSKLASLDQQFAVGAASLQYITDEMRWKYPLVPMQVDMKNPPIDPGKAKAKLVDDPRFPGVSYYTQAEKDMVDHALQAGSQAFFQQTSNTLIRLNLDLILFGISATGADRALILCCGISPTGEPVSTSDRIMAGVSLGSQALLVGALATRSYGKLIVAEEQAAQRFETIALADMRASIQLGMGIKAALAAAATTPVAAVPELADVTTPTIPGAQLVANDKRWQSLIQEGRSNCGISDIEWARRSAGRYPRTELDNTIRAWEVDRELNANGTVYAPNGGLSRIGVMSILEQETATVAAPTDANLGMVARELKNGQKILAMVDVSTSGPAAYHWIGIESFASEGNGNFVVTYFDPWNGNVWKVDACTLWQRLSRDDLGRVSDIVFVKWK